MNMLILSDTWLCIPPCHTYSAVVMTTGLWCSIGTRIGIGLIHMMIMSTMLCNCPSIPKILICSHLPLSIEASKFGPFLQRKVRPISVWLVTWQVLTVLIFATTKKGLISFREVTMGKSKFGTIKLNNAFILLKMGIKTMCHLWLSILIFQLFSQQERTMLSIFGTLWHIEMNRL